MYSSAFLRILVSKIRSSAVKSVHGSKLTNSSLKVFRHRRENVKEAEGRSTSLIVLPVVVAAVAAALVGHLLGLRHHFEILSLHFEGTLHVHRGVVGRRALVVSGERGRVELLGGAGMPVAVTFSLALAAGLLLLRRLRLCLCHRQLISVQYRAELHLCGQVRLLLVARRHSLQT